MRALCVVTCGKKKIWDLDPSAGPMMARDVYVGPFVGKCIAYAEMFHPESWCILSAKYGFLWPDDMVPGPYDVSFLKPGSNTIRDEELISQIRSKGLDDCKSIIVLGGRTYANIVRRCFSGRLIIEPLSGCGRIGNMTHQLKVALDSSSPLA